MLNLTTSRRIAIAALVIAALLVVGIVLLRPADASDTSRARSLAPAPATQAVSNGVKAIGTFTSANQAALAFQLAGRVKEIKVKEGDSVQAGALLASLDTSILDLQVAQAQAALDLATANLDKVTAGPTADDMALAKSKLDLTKAAVAQAQAAYDRIGGASNPFIAMTPQSLALEQATQNYQGALAAYNLTVNHPTASELKMAQAQAAQAQAVLDLAKQNLANAKIVAPFDGVVVWVGAHMGETISPNVPALMLADLSQMQVQVGVDENTLAAIQVGQSATITADAIPGRTLTGHVSKIGLLATTTAGIISVPVTVDVDPSDAPIYPGLSATIEIQR